MLRLQPVFEMDLPMAQLTPPEVDLALLVLEKGGASSAHLGERPPSPWHRVYGGKPVCFPKHIYFQRDHPRTKGPPGNSSLCGGRGKPTVLRVTEKETTTKT